jgi:hypothetical protein
MRRTLELPECVHGQHFLGVLGVGSVSDAERHSITVAAFATAHAASAIHQNEAVSGVGFGLPLAVAGESLRLGVDHFAMREGRDGERLVVKLEAQAGAGACAAVGRLDIQVRDLAQVGQYIRV